MVVSSLFRSVRRAHDAIVDAMAAVATVALLAMAVLITVHVLGRATIGASVRGVNELSQYLLVGVVYAGLAVALRDGSFIRVRLLLDRLDSRFQLWSIRFVALLSLGFMALLTWQSWLFAYTSWERGTESIGVLETPLWVPQSIVAFGSTALTMQLLVIVIDPRSQQEDSPVTDGGTAALETDQ